ncbi:CPBP family intramembrane metalloprotease [Filobacillus milosensis]|uniref:CPBP family intramembrane metalloprotease n=1 Tax=Filobacillus milosensis TaxID=94137 RepID=A0A4Y8IX53_9BACI|nr:type II CAAX endopeptidase family protein [Filobacillus milosensis]TFB23945.1 CPBP family intramembrane metalloprotease [Filobacillus milosensis]
MKKMSQGEIIKKLTDRELILNLYLSQIIFIVLAITLSIFLFDRHESLFKLFEWNVNDIFWFGIVPGLLVVVIDILLIKFLHEKHYDDGGINSRIFKAISVPHIFFISLVISFSEELLFRGVIQTSFGFIFASLLFALVHFRYLKKIVLLVSVLLLSFLIGYMYEITENLLVSISAHFTIDFLLGIYYRLYRE